MHSLRKKTKESSYEELTIKTYWNNSSWNVRQTFSHKGWASLHMLLWCLAPPVMLCSQGVCSKWQAWAYSKASQKSRTSAPQQGPYTMAVTSWPFNKGMQQMLGVLSQISSCNTRSLSTNDDNTFDILMTYFTHLYTIIKHVSSLSSPFFSSVLKVLFHVIFRGARCLRSMAFLGARRGIRDDLISFRGTRGRGARTSRRPQKQEIPSQK